MNRATPRLRALTALPFVLALAAHLLLLALRYDRLPDPLATHFGTGGTADGFTGRAAFAFVSTALLLGLGVGWTLLGRRAALWGPGRRPASPARSSPSSYGTTWTPPTRPGCSRRWPTSRSRRASRACAPPSAGP
ncbi:DUF1648 domain-containing protein [Streptomyces diastatochromogenes]|nr:DUF1648 domain-containing protein [Streptomyces diastatochromogenes]